LSILLVEQNVGAIRFQGTPGELLHNPELKRAYLGV